MDKSESDFPAPTEGWDTTVTRAMEHARERADRAKEENLAKSRFLAELSHELRTPLNGLLGMVNLMLNSEDPKEKKEYADFALRCGDMIQDLISAILEFSQLEIGEISSKTTPFSPAELFGDIKRLTETRAADKGLWLKFHLDPGLPTELIGDEARIRQVLLNLISNSIKFTAQGQLTLAMDMTSENEKTIQARFSVSDTGCGVPLDLQQRIFLPYFKGDPLRRDGTGLGLSICKQIVERLGGQIELESKPGMGSTFLFELSLGRKLF